MPSMEENGESAVRFGKIFNLMIKPLVLLLCCRSHTHAANIKFQPNACSSCFKQYFFFLLGGENIHNYFITSTRSFMINPCPLIGCRVNSDRKVKQFRVTPRIASSRLVFSSSIQCFIFECVWFCNAKLSRNRHRAKRLDLNGF